MKFAAKILATLVFAAAALPAGKVVAAGAEGTFAVEGVGQLPCSVYVEERENEGRRYFAFAGWMNGYLTAYNQFNEATYDITPYQSLGLLAAFMSSFCADNPDMPFYEALVRLTDELAPVRLTGTSEVLTLEHGGETVQIYRRVLERAQGALKERGLYDGGIDGAYGPGTRGALLAFQQAQDIRQTGLPDQITLLRLFNAP